MNKKFPEKEFEIIVRHLNEQKLQSSKEITIENDNFNQRH